MVVAGRGTAHEDRTPRGIACIRAGRVAEVVVGGVSRCRAVVKGDASGASKDVVAYDVAEPASALVRLLPVDVELEDVVRVGVVLGALDEDGVPLTPQEDIVLDD